MGCSHRVFIFVMTLVSSFGFPVPRFRVPRGRQRGTPSASHESRSDRLHRLAKDTTWKHGGRSGKTPKVDMDASPIRVLLVEDSEVDYLLVRRLFSKIETYQFSKIETHQFKLDWVATCQAALELMTRDQHD